MFRTKLLATIAIIVITSVASINVAYGETDALLGHASVQDDQGINDSVTVTVDGVEVPGDGVTYSAHLVSADGASALDLGIAIVHGVIQSTGSINHTFDSGSAGYDGSNLLSQYNRVRIVESSDGSILYGGGITTGSSTEINSVITKAASLNDLLDVAIADAAAARAASDVTAAAGSLAAIIDAVPSIQALAAEIADHAGLAEEKGPPHARRAPRRGRRQARRRRPRPAPGDGCRPVAGCAPIAPASRYGYDFRRWLAAPARRLALARDDERSERRRRRRARSHPSMEKTLGGAARP